MGMPRSLGWEPCEGQVIAQLVELQKKKPENWAQRDGRILPDELFYAQQNARLVKNAEEYYRAMYGGRGAHSEPVDSWNLRDTHMADTVDALMDDLLDREGQVKMVVWAQLPPGRRPGHRHGTPGRTQRGSASAGTPS